MELEIFQEQIEVFKYFFLFFLISEILQVSPNISVFLKIFSRIKVYFFK